jgi:hypothetical protein
MAQSRPALESRPCADISEFQVFRQQEYRKQALLEQTGGGEAFVDAAAPVIRKSVLQAIAYGSPSAKYVQALRHAGVPDRDLDVALARAWLHSSDSFEIPKRSAATMFYGTAALLAYSILIVLVLMIMAIFYLRHAHPVLAESLLGVPPIFAVAGVPLVVVLFMLMRKIVH